MDLQNTVDVVTLLRARLEPAGQARGLSGASEGPLPNARRSAVLLGLFEMEGRPALLFIRRSATLRAHSGEIAFPGGGIDPGDASLVTTALREAQEEVGLDPARIEVMGVLAPVFTVVSNYLILPVVAYLPAGLGTLRLQASEVTEIILAPLCELAKPEVFHSEEWLRLGRAHTVFFYDYGAYRIWGATARMLNELLTTLQP